MRRRRTWALGTLTLLLVVAVSGGPATAAPKADAGGPAHPRPTAWTSIQDGTIVYPAGETCPFELRLDVVRDEDWLSTFEWYANGEPRRQVVVGPLVYRLTNVATGESTIRDFGGTTELLLREDGAVVLRAIGAIGIGIQASRDPTEMPGFYFEQGYTTVEILASGEHRILEATGPSENLCVTLT